MSLDPHVLSIQSHVSRDYVGNRAATVTLQLLGHDVDVINTVAFSSMFVHQGTVLNGADFATIVAGLKQAIMNARGDGTVGGNTSASKFEHHDIPIVCTGYTVDLDVLDQIGGLVDELKDRPCTSEIDGHGVVEGLRRVVPRLRGSALWVLDPVIGDNNHKYVPENVVAKYRALIGKADVVTPNEWELRWLTDCGAEPFQSIGQVLDLAQRVHEQGPSVVFVTSFALSKREGHLYSAVSIQTEGGWLKYVYRFENKQTYIGGCGDVVNALLVDELMRASSVVSTGPQQWEGIVQRVLNKLQRMVETATAKGWPSLNVVKMSRVLTEEMDAGVRRVGEGEEE